MIKSERIPQEFTEPCAKGGRTEILKYRAGEYDKEALVYLPNGYDEGRGIYNVFTLCHGGGGTVNEFLVGTRLKNVLDNMIERGLLNPLIVVCPTYYHAGTESALTSIGDCVKLTETFHIEYVNSLIPAIDRTYRTSASREGRAFGGFSMGSEATWSTLAGAAKSTKYYLPMSGDYWKVGIKGGAGRTEETCDTLIDGILSCGVGTDEVKIFAATGTADIVYEAMNPMVCELCRRSGYFTESDTDFSNGNIIYCLSDGYHSSDFCCEYMFRGLPLFFRG